MVLHFYNFINQYIKLVQGTYINMSNKCNGHKSIYQTYSRDVYQYHVSLSRRVFPMLQVEMVSFEGYTYT